VENRLTRPLSPDPHSRELVDHTIDFERSAARDWLERRITEARAHGRNDFEAHRLLHDLQDAEADRVVAARAAARIV
jgi:hypothetical protein